MNKTFLLFKDELQGFAKSAVMIALWVGMPALGILLYFLIPQNMTLPTENGVPGPSLTYLLSFSLTSLGGLLASIMISIEIVNERNGGVYDILFMRPVARSAIVWAKFFAVFLCVAIALAFTLFTGIIFDMIRGAEISDFTVDMVVRSYLSNLQVVMLASAMGVITGVISNTVLIAVIINVFVAQNFIGIPAMPTLLGLSDYQWIFTIVTFLVTLALMLLSGYVFSKKDI